MRQNFIASFVQFLKHLLWKVVVDDTSYRPSVIITFFWHNADFRKCFGTSLQWNHWKDCWQLSRSTFHRMSKFNQDPVHFYCAKAEQSTLHNSDLFGFQINLCGTHLSSFFTFLNWLQWWEIIAGSMLSSCVISQTVWHVLVSTKALNWWETSLTLLVFKTQITTMKFLQPKLNCALINWFLNKYFIGTSCSLCSTALHPSLIVRINYMDSLFFHFLLVVYMEGK
jgi:hypothetical protein